MDDFNEFEFDEYMDVGCPSCGAQPSEDCSEDCMPYDGIHPMMYQLAQEKMEYVAHKVGKVSLVTLSCSCSNFDHAELSPTGFD